MSRFSRHVCFFTTVVVLLAMAFSAAQATPVVHYKFDGNALDSAGTAHGTIGSQVTFSPGVFGQAANFGITTNTDPFVSDHQITVLQTDAYAPGTSDFSITFWIKRGDVDANFHGIFDAINGTSSGYQSALLNDGRINFRISSYVAASQYAITDTDDFHHVAIVVDRLNEELTFYFNGTAETPHDFSNLSTPVGNVVPNQNLYFGALNAVDPLNGFLDDFRIYNRALLPEEVAATMVPEPAGSALFVLIGTAIGCVRRRRRGDR